MLWSAYDERWERMMKRCLLVITPANCLWPVCFLYPVGLLSISLCFVTFFLIERCSKCFDKKLCYFGCVVFLKIFFNKCTFFPHCLWMLQVFGCWACQGCMLWRRDSFMFSSLCCSHEIDSLTYYISLLCLISIIKILLHSRVAIGLSY